MNTDPETEMKKASRQSKSPHSVLLDTPPIPDRGKLVPGVKGAVQVVVLYICACAVTGPRRRTVQAPGERGDVTFLRWTRRK